MCIFVRSYLKDSALDGRKVTSLQLQVTALNQQPEKFQVTHHTCAVAPARLNLYSQSSLVCTKTHRYHTLFV